MQFSTITSVIGESPQIDKLAVSHKAQGYRTLEAADRCHSPANIHRIGQAVTVPRLRLTVLNIHFSSRVSILFLVAPIHSFLFFFLFLQQILLIIQTVFDRIPSTKTHLKKWQRRMMTARVIIPCINAFSRMIYGN